MDRFSQLILATLLTFLTSTPLFADLDPDLAAVGNQNESSVFIGGNLHFGQCYATGGSNPGIGYLATVEPGYMAARDSWGRLEFSLQLGTGHFGYTKTGDSDAKVSIPVGALAMVKLGYGMSLGSKLFGMFRVGAGPVMATFKSTSHGVETKSDGAVTGMAGLLGYDLVAPMSSMLDVVGGFELTHVSMELNDTKVDGVKENNNDSINLNLPMITIGARLKF